MSGLLGYAPVAAACFGVPQFLPQLLKLRTAGGCAGVSWSWAALTTVNNAAWIAYFALSRDWTALIPSCSVTLLAGVLTVALAGRQQVPLRALAMIGAWTAALAAAGFVTGRAGLGTLLTAAFAVQVAPSLRAAYRTARPSGISAGTWTLILGELACFLAYGLHESDPRLIALGATGVAASTLMIARVIWTSAHARNRHGAANVCLGEAPTQVCVVHPRRVRPGRINRRSGETGLHDTLPHRGHGRSKRAARTGRREDDSKSQSGTLSLNPRTQV